MKRRHLLTNIGLLPALITIVLDYARGLKGKIIDALEFKGNNVIAYIHFHEASVFLLFGDGSVWKMHIGGVSEWNKKSRILPPYQNGFIDVGDGGCWVIVDERGEHLYSHRTEHHLDGGPITYVSLVNGRSYNLADYHYPTRSPCALADGLVFQNLRNEICFYSNYAAPCVIVSAGCKTMTVYKHEILWIADDGNLWMFNAKSTFRMMLRTARKIVNDNFTIWIELCDHRWMDWVNNVYVSSLDCPKTIGNGDFLVKTTLDEWMHNVDQKRYSQNIKNAVLLPSGELVYRTESSENEVYIFDDSKVQTNFYERNETHCHARFLAFAILRTSKAQKAVFLLFCNNALISFK